MTEGGERDEGAAGDIVLYVCVECGREYQFEGGDRPSPELECEKCGNQVFRRFDASASPSEAAQDFRDETERELATSDPEGDAEPGDLRDLNNP
jgi:DNA-directed RNA polymerase subunit RPC12/RpoP